MVGIGARRRLGVAAALVGGEIVPGDVTVDEGRIEAIGVAPAGARGLAVAGFVDLQVNGFAGVDFTSADTAGHRRALTAMAAHGVTACLPTLPTAAPDAYRPALRELAASVETGQRPTHRRPGTAACRPLGAHLEGPFLNPARRGAHRLDWLRHPDPALLQEWLRLAPIAVVTLAPELAGADRLIELAAAQGVRVALGHSEASAGEAARAFDRGARLVTHLWNAQRPPTAREPGLVGAALTRADAHVGVIADLVHVHADLVRLSLAAAGRRAFVVSDALDLAGLPAGTYRRVDGRDQHSDGTAVRLADGTLAGSALALDGALRNLVSIGVPLLDGIHAVTANPAAALGRDDVGHLAVGAPADVVVLDDRLDVTTVVCAGVAVER